MGDNNKFALMWKAIKSGDKETAKALSDELSLVNATTIYNGANNTNIQEPIIPLSSGEIKEHVGPLYKNKYDRWTTETAQGQEFKRFVNGPLKFGVETILGGAAGAGTANRLRKGLTLMKSAEVAPLAEDLLSTVGTTLFGMHGAKGIKQDLRGERKFNPLQTGLDLLMSVPLVSEAKPIANNIDKAYNAGNMWARALRGEQPAVHRVRRLLNNKTALKDVGASRNYWTEYATKQRDAYENAKSEIANLEMYAGMDPTTTYPLTNIVLTHGKYPDIHVKGSSGFVPVEQPISFTNPLTGMQAVGKRRGLIAEPDYDIKINTLTSGTRFKSNRFAWPWSIVKYAESNPKSIFDTNKGMQSAVREYRDAINQILNEDGIVGGSTHSIAEGLHSGVPNDLEVYTTPHRLDAVLKKLNANITDRSTRRLKGTSPLAPHQDIDIHVLDRNGIDWDQIEAAKFPEKVAAERLKEAINTKQSIPEPLEIDDYWDLPEYPEYGPLTDNELAERMLSRMRKEPGFLTSLMRKNNLVGIGGKESAQLKFSNRQTEMGLHLPLEELDQTYSNIEAQIPTFINFEKAYPNFDYANVEGNKAFLNYFRLPEEYAYDVERMKRLYRQAHIQISPSIRQFKGAKDLKTWRQMARKNAQYHGGDASGAGGNMLLASNTGGMPGAPQVTAAQYLPTYHPENITSGSDYVNAIEKTKLFNRDFTTEEFMEAVKQGLINPSKHATGTSNISDVLQNIAREDLENPEVNKTIQKISRIIDVPRMTGVRYGGTNSTYVGNLSGEPISETFSLDKPFEFGRSFVDELAPIRTTQYGMGINGSIEDIPVKSLTPEMINDIDDVETFGRLIKGDFSTAQHLRNRGFKIISNPEQLNSELENLKNVKYFRTFTDTDKVFRNLYSKLNHIDTKQHIIKQAIAPTLLGTGMLGILGSGFYAIGDHVINDPMRFEAFNRLYNNNPEYKSLYNNLYKEKDRKVRVALRKRLDLMLEQYVEDHKKELQEITKNKKGNIIPPSKPEHSNKQ